LPEVNETEGKQMLAHAGWWSGFGLLWILLFWGAVVFFFRRRRGWWGGPRASGEAVLGERYARGEITEEEYRERLRVLKDGR
jgi:putative membrane protein